MLMETLKNLLKNYPEKVLRFNLAVFSHIETDKSVTERLIEDSLEAGYVLQVKEKKTN